MRNPEFNAASLKPAGYPDNSALETPLRIRILFGRETAVVDVRTGETFEPADSLETTLDPWSPVILQLRNLGTDH